MGVLALALLVTGVVTDNHDVSVATDDLALVADFLNAGVYLHDVSLSLSSYRELLSYRPLLLSSVYL